MSGIHPKKVDIFGSEVRWGPDSYCLLLKKNKTPLLTFTDIALIHPNPTLTALLECWLNRQSNLWMDRYDGVSYLISLAGVQRDSESDSWIIPPLFHRMVPLPLGNLFIYFFALFFFHVGDGARTSELGNGRIFCISWQRWLACHQCICLLTVSLVCLHIISTNLCNVFTTKQRHPDSQPQTVGRILENQLWLRELWWGGNKQREH